MLPLTVHCCFAACVHALRFYHRALLRWCSSWSFAIQSRPAARASAPQACATRVRDRPWCAESAGGGAGRRGGRAPRSARARAPRAPPPRSRAHPVQAAPAPPPPRPRPGPAAAARCAAAPARSKPVTIHGAVGALHFHQRPALARPRHTLHGGSQRGWMVYRAASHPDLMRCG